MVTCAARDGSLFSIWNLVLKPLYAPTSRSTSGSSTVLLISPLSIARYDANGLALLFHVSAVALSNCCSGATFWPFFDVSMRTEPVKFDGTPKESGSRNSVACGAIGRPPFGQPFCFVALFEPGLYGSHAISPSVLLLR